MGGDSVMYVGSNRKGRHRGFGKRLEGNRTNCTLRHLSLGNQRPEGYMPEAQAVANPMGIRLLQ